MAIQSVNLGAVGTGAGGDTLRIALQKINENFETASNAASRPVQAADRDTTAGSVLIVGAGGWLNILNLPNITQAELDSFLPSGMYRVATPAGLPSGTYVVMNYRVGTALQAQELIGVNVANRRHQRWQSSTTLDAPWSTVFNQSNILGTVSQSGGVPTGAVVERGSNANGEYVRFADGTQICSMSISVTDQAIDTAYGALFQGTRTWSFPAAFAAAPAVSCGLFKWGSGASWSGTGGSASTSTATLRGWDTLSRPTGTATAISATAIGRWY